MFDTYVAPTRTEYVTRRVEVTERRAPTDASVKLLKEMEQAADAKRTASMQMPGNLFKGVVEIYETMHDHNVHARAVFDINGNRMTTQVTHSLDESREQLLDALHARVAEKIATTILIEMTRGMKMGRAY